MTHPTNGPWLTLRQRCAAVEWLVLDVDGVLTEGGITYAADPAGELKTFHVRDGSALKRWHAAGKRSAVITGRSSSVLSRRATELGVHQVWQGVSDKCVPFAGLLAEQRVTADAVCYVGDDGPDVPLLRQVGLAIAVADAGAGPRANAHYITRAAGGRGAVAEVVALVLGCQGLLVRDGVSG